MRLLFDNNISYRLVNRLRPDIDCEHVVNLGLDESPDQEIWEFAGNNGYHIFTKDDDFVWLSNLNGYPPKVIWLRTGNCTTQVIENLIRDNAQAIREALAIEVGIIDLLSLASEQT